MRRVYSSATIHAVEGNLNPEHRNGSSKTITVAHQLHLLRFANVAQQMHRCCRDAMKIDKAPSLFDNIVGRPHFLNAKEVEVQR